MIKLDTAASIPVRIINKYKKNAIIVSININKANCIVCFTIDRNVVATSCKISSASSLTLILNFTKRSTDVRS